MCVCLQIHFTFSLASFCCKAKPRWVAFKCQKGRGHFTCQVPPWIWRQGISQILVISLLCLPFFVTFCNFICPLCLLHEEPFWFQFLFLSFIKNQLWSSLKYLFFNSFYAKACISALTSSFEKLQQKWQKRATNDEHIYKSSTSPYDKHKKCHIPSSFKLEPFILSIF